MSPHLANILSPCPAPSEAELMAFDALIEMASLLNGESCKLLAAAAIGDPAAVEACLWTSRRVLTEAIRSWREVTPPNAGGAA